MEKGGVMTRKDSEKDSERPHYYSQFWLDIAAGRRVIGGPKPEEAETSEPEIIEPVAPTRKAGRSTSDSPRATLVSPIAVETVSEPEEAIDETELPNIVLEGSDDAAIPEEDEEFFEDEQEEDEFFDEEEEEEEEGSEEWGGRRTAGRKKAKPVRPVKPVVNKPKRPNTRRTF